MTVDTATAPDRERRRYAPWLFGALLACNILLLLFALSLAHATADGPATRSIRQTLAIALEIDSYLDSHYDDLRAEAATTSEPILLPELPIAIAVTPEEVRTMDRTGLRALILDRAAADVRANGSAALRQDGGSGAEVREPEDILATGLDFLRPRPHDALMVAVVIFAISATLLAGGLWMSVRGEPLFALGLTIFVAANGFLLFAVAFRYSLRVAAQGANDYVVREFAELGQEMTWAAIRNGMIFTVGAAVILVAGSILSISSRAQHN